MQHTHLTKFAFRFTMHLNTTKISKLWQNGFKFRSMIEMKYGKF